jgi:hypothetical protein
MVTASEIKVEHFFASRGGVCVYVTVRRRAFRVQFASPQAQGVVAEAEHADAEEALGLARAALERYAVGLTPLFEKVARGMT